MREWGGEVPYVGYVEVHLDLPQITAFHEDILMLVTDNSPYTKRVPVAIGTLHIDLALDLIMEEEIVKLGRAWCRGCLSTLLMLKSDQLITEKDELFDLKQVHDEVRTTMKITLQPLESKYISSMSKVKGHTKKVNPITESPTKPYYHYACTAPSFAIMDQRSSRVHVTIRNTSCKVVTIRTKMVIAMMCPANIIPPMLAPKIPQEEKEESKWILNT